MKELVVASGKGGTGKTSIVAAFAALAREKVMVDCDVDAADLHLVLAPDIRRREPFVSGHEAVIRQESCTGCGLCRDVCQFDAVVESAGSAEPRFRIRPQRCEGCGVCVHFCPEQAIEFPARQCGEWFHSRTRHGTLVHAKLGVAAENSGRLVTLVRQQARLMAGELGVELILADGPPGIGCPVIASLTGADMLLAVTEPSQSGLHDLQRLSELAAHFRVQTSVCVNKHDLDHEQAGRIVAWCRQADVPVLGLIPYDTGVTAAQRAGLSVVEMDSSPAGEAVRRLWRQTALALGLKP